MTHCIDTAPLQAPAPDRRQNKRRADAVIELLAETWPECFSIWEKRRRPLKIGIHRDVLAALDGAVTPVELSRAFRFTSVTRCTARASSPVPRVSASMVRPPAR